MNAEVIEPASRVLPLEGGCNFRDIGGYAAADGKRVRWGRVYRTGVLSYFTEGDCTQLLDLRVRTICDLRREEERQREPTRWPDGAVQLRSWSDGTQMPTIRGFAAGRPRTGAGMYDSMIDLYRALPGWMAPRIRGLFECIAAGDTPLVVHCAAGKDRTGVAIAVLLSSLGVTRNTIFEDYLLTNESGNFEAFIAARRNSHLGLADAHDPLLSMPQEMRSVLFAAEADFLDAALQCIDSEYGGIDRYLDTAVQLDPQLIEQVRAHLLT